MTAKYKINARNIPTLITLGFFVIMFAVGPLSFPGFLSPQNFLNLFIDNSYLLILGVGMTFVILTGGIDLSVGSLIAFGGVIAAWIVHHGGTPPAFWMFVGWSVWMLIPLYIIAGTFWPGMEIAQFNIMFRLTPKAATQSGPSRHNR